jgi:hypothetical protein
MLREGVEAVASFVVTTPTCLITSSSEATDFQSADGSKNPSFSRQVRHDGLANG